MSYLIFTDMSVDIDRAYADANDVKYIPMEYVLGDETFYCETPESDEMMHNYYEKLRLKVTTQTSQITPSHYEDAFRPFVSEGTEILYIALSSGLSKTYESALLAARNLKEEYENAAVEVVDSLGATGGVGILVEAAIRNRNNGMGLEENAKWLRENAINVNFWFKVEDLMYLKRGGRVSAATAVVGTALGIKPILTINKEGRLDTIDKKRGNKMALKSLVDRYLDTVDESLGNIVYICSGDCMEDAGMLKNMILEKNSKAEVKITMLSPIIGAHTGPDMLALVYFGKPRQY